MTRIGGCALCGRTPAAGFATINGARYCHGDYGREPTCYMRSQWRLAGAAALLQRCGGEDA